MSLSPRCAFISGAADPLGAEFTQVMENRRAEADEFYAELPPSGAGADEALVLRQASAGMLWSKQLFYYDVSRWLDGDPAQPVPPDVRKSGRNSRWRNFDGFDIISMPDKWEYPWFAAWDLAFQCVPLAHLDPAFAKYQLILVCREWFQHPQGAFVTWRASQSVGTDSGRQASAVGNTVIRAMSAGSSATIMTSRLEDHTRQRKGGVSHGRGIRLPSGSDRRRRARGPVRRPGDEERAGSGDSPGPG